MVNHPGPTQVNAAEIACVLEPAAQLGEGAVWSVRNGVLHDRPPLFGLRSLSDRIDSPPVQCRRDYGRMQGNLLIRGLRQGDA